MKIRSGFLILLFILILFPVSALASTWAKTYAGGSMDEVGSIQQTSDGGFIVAGYTLSYGAGNLDIWLLKLNDSGDVTWQKTYGSINNDGAYSIQETSDGGFIVVGYQDTSDEPPRCDIWLLKLNSTGDVTWQKTYGGINNDGAYSIQETSDGGFIVAGYTLSYGAGGEDIWVLKLNSTGDVTWQKTYGGYDFDRAYSIQQTTDGGFIVAGYTGSYGAGGEDIWVLKLNSTGNVIWQKTYGRYDYYEVAQSIQETSDGGFIVAGYTSYGGGGYDIWVLKLNSTGDVTWQKTYGGSSFDIANSIQQTSDGGFIVAGQTFSYGAGISDTWVLKLDANGNVTWQKTYGDSGNELANSIKQTSDGGFIVAGHAQFFFEHPDVDTWVLKLDANGNIPGCDLIQDTSVVPVNTSVTPITTSITPANTSATVTNTSVVPINTNATVEIQCFDQSPLFVDVPSGYWAEEAIYKIYDAGITTGCSQNPLRYCPENPVTRTQMAVFLGRAIHGSTFTPPAAIGFFSDVPMSYWAADWIEQFYNDGITTGCATNPPRYCPYNNVTRAQMAIFLLRSKHGSSYTPPAATGIFADVPVTYWAVDWIEQLYREGITTGCGTNPLQYCPNNSVTRAQMAVFMMRTFGL